MTLPRLQPVFLESAPSATFQRVLSALKELAAGLAVWLEPLPIAAAAGTNASAVVVPDFSGKVYGQLSQFAAIGDAPIVLATSDHGTVFMWDWEGRDWLRRRGVHTLAPTSLTEFQDILRALRVKEELPGATMLAYWDDLGAGQQPDIFKRFFWWEDECSDLLTSELGVNIEKRSFRELNARAQGLSDARLETELKRVEGQGVPMSSDLAKRARIEALRLKLALSDELDETPGVIAAGINCLNESETSLTTPCLAWNLLFEERGLIWGCEADLTSMITKYLIHKSLDVPAVMTNLYPFLMGGAALDHEKIPYFPPVPDHPEDHILAAHCGFFALMPQSMSTRWELKPAVLGIVDEGGNVIDAEMAAGDITLVKIASTMDTLAITPARLTGYEQYENSDCLNGGVLRVGDGHRFVENLTSHHYIIAQGDLSHRIQNVAEIIGLSTTTV
jgi:hypothetical protein